MSDVYVRYLPRDTHVARTVEAMVNGAHCGIMVDLDAQGEIIGVELLDAEAVQIDGQPARPSCRSSSTRTPALGCPTCIPPEG